MTERTRLRKGASIAATLLCCLLVSIGPARAQSAEAEALFDEGDALMKKGKLAQACDAFEASNRIEARAGTLIRLGACREQNQQLASAWSAYKDALTRVKDPAKKKIATSKVAELGAKLSKLTVSVPEDNQVDGLTVERNGKSLDEALWNRAVPIDGGTYIIVARAPGYEKWKTTVKVANASASVWVEVPTLREHHDAAPAPAKHVAETSPAPEPPPDQGDEDDEEEAPTMWTVPRKVAVGLGGVTAIGVVTGIVLGRQSKSKHDDALALCPDPGTPCADSMRANVLIQSSRTRAIAADGAFVVAGVAAIAAGVLWFTGAPESSHHVAIVPSSTSEATVLTVVGGF